MVVGHDMRPSSPDLAKALIDGINSTGMKVIDVGMVDTSFIYFAINHLDAVGGIQVTASHNPIQYNGFKISGPKAKPIGAASGLDDIKRIATTLRVGQTGLKGSVEQMDLWPAYRKHVLQFLKLKRPHCGWRLTPATEWQAKWFPPFSIMCQIWRSSRCCLRSPEASFMNPIRWWSRTCTCSRRKSAKPSRIWASALTATPTAVSSWMRRAKPSAATW